ncbi:tail fiber domain-containing protein, partial [bacterium]|nr:tail fiber domain-containing protein [bacterium]
FAPETNGNRTLGTSSFRWSTVYATNGTINTSDRRDKKDIKDIQYGLNEVMKLRPVSFTWKDQPEMGTKLGLIAQDLQEVISEVVLDKEWIENEETGEKEEVEAERLGVFYADLIPVLIKSVQEQQGIIEQQRKDIDALRKEVDQLKKK